MLELVDNFSFWTTAEMPGPNFNSVATGTGSAVPSIVSEKLKLEQSSSTQTCVKKTLSGDLGTVIVNGRFAVNRFSSAGGTICPAGSAVIFVLIDDVTMQCGLCLKSNGKLQFFRGTTLIGTQSTNAITADPDIFYDYEAKIVVGNAGTVELQINGAVEIGPAEVVDNQTTGNATVSEIWFTGASSEVVATYILHKHIVVMNDTAPMDDFLGVVAVRLLKPDAAGASADFLRGGVDSGFNFSQVNEVDPDDDTAYVASETIDDLDLYNVENLPPGITDVHAVALFWRARREDSGARGLSGVLSSGSVDVGANQNISETYAWFHRFDEIDPDTAVAWDPADIDTLQVGVKLTT